MRPQLLYPWLTAVLLLGIAGCDPEFSEPLSNGQTSEIDEQLLGDWYIVASAGEGVTPDRPVNVAKAKDGKTLDLQWPKDKNGGDDDGPKQVWATKVGEQTFLSFVKYVPSKDKLFTIMSYRVDGKALRLYMLDDETFGDAVVAGKLKGTVEESKGFPRLFRPKYSSVKVTDTPAHVREFLAAHQAKDLIECLTFSRERPQAGAEPKSPAKQSTAAPTATTPQKH